jgi:hypothetical protein
MGTVPSNSGLSIPSPLLIMRMPVLKQQEILKLLQEQAERHEGLDYLQVFDDPEKTEALWMIEDRIGGAITAMLPSDY